MTSYGRGRGDPFPNRGRGNRGGRFPQGRGFPTIQYGNTRLINSDISGIALLKELENNPESLKKVQEILKSNSSEEGSSSSFANIVAEQDENDSYERKAYSQKILILEKRDLQWKEEPWLLLQRYLGTASYAAISYKQRLTFESMLKATNSAEIRHFLPTTQAKTYNFSKIIIKQIISAEEWGLNPQSERDFSVQNQNIPIRFNFWDYNEAFYKTFYYQNPQKKHTWFIKICPLVYKRKIPNWFFEWWLIFGADEKILPEQFFNLFEEWKKVSPAIIEAEYDNTYCHNRAILHFFCEFGIPWIWRWEPEVNYIHDNIPCLKRVSFIKFWKRMVRNNAEGLIEGQETIDLIKSKIAEYKERINNQQQRKAFNPFDIIEERISTRNLSRQEKIDEFMKEAKEAILKKLGNNEEDDNPDPSDLSLFQDSQDPYDMEDDDRMAEFYANMYPEGRSSKVSTGSGSDNLMDEDEGPSNSKKDYPSKGSKKKTRARKK